MYDIGAQVEKFTGDYQLPGEVIGRFWTKAGKLRYVVEHYGGICHIYNETQLRLFPAGKTVKWEWVDGMPPDPDVDPATGATVE